MRKWSRDVSGRYAWLLDQADEARGEAARLRQEGNPKRAELWERQAEKYEAEATAYGWQG